MLRSKTWKGSSDLVYKSIKARKMELRFFEFFLLSQKNTFHKVLSNNHNSISLSSLEYKRQSWPFLWRKCTFLRTVGPIHQTDVTLLISLHKPRVLNLFPRFKGATKIFRLAHFDNSSRKSRNLWLEFKFLETFVSLAKISEHVSSIGNH